MWCFFPRYKLSSNGKAMDHILRQPIATSLVLLFLTQFTYIGKCTENATSVAQVEESNAEMASEDSRRGGSEGSSSYPYQEAMTEMHPTTELLFNLLNTYDQRVRPPAANDGPTLVRVNIIVISMDSVTEVSMDYSMTILLHQYWNDPRLAYVNMTKKAIPYITSGHTFTSKIWVPDLFFANEKRASFHDVTVQNKLIRLFPNGDLFYSMKLSIVLFCPMDFKAFPMDKQKCRTVIESYQNTDQELVLVWNEPEFVKFTEISLPQYSMLPDVYHGQCIDRISIAGNFSCVDFSFTLVRELTFYVLQTYIPTSLLVFISWVSFWIEIGQAPARCSLGVTTILTMTTTTVGYGSSAGLPKVSYTKAIDIWFDACLTFVIGSLVEYAVVHYLWTRDRAEKHLRWALRKESTRLGQNGGNRSPLNGSLPADMGKQPDPFGEQEKNAGNRYSYQTAYRPVRSSMHFSEDPEAGFPVSKLETGVDKDSFHEKRRSKLLALRIDRAARFFFPVCYGAFIVVYWGYYSHVYMKPI